MAICPRLSCTLIATALAAALSGCAFLGPILPTRSPAGATPSAYKAPPAEWVLTTDPPSGVSAMLPVQPSVDNTSIRTDDGDTLPLRQYLVNLSDGRGQALFQVSDAPGRILDLDKSVQAVAESLQHFTSSEITGEHVVHQGGSACGVS
jgi:hypothetical protein